MAKSITFILPEELHVALKKKQAEMAMDNADGKRVPLHILVPKLLAKGLGIRLTKGWDEELKETKKETKEAKK